MGKYQAAILLMKRWQLVWQFGGDESLKLPELKPEISFNAKTMKSVRSAVFNGLGYSLAVMQMTQSDTYDGGKVVGFPLTDNNEPLPMVLVTKIASTDSALIENFITFCLSKLKH